MSIFIGRRLNLLHTKFPSSEEWTPADAASVAAEGWELRERPGSVFGATQLQKIDELELFVSDDDAMVHVRTKAFEGSALHVKALALVRRYNPSEMECIEMAVKWS